MDQAQATAVASGDFAVRFSATEWHEPDLRDAVWELYGRTIWQAEFAPLPEGPVQIEAKFRTLPGLRLADVTCSGTRRSRRTTQHLNDDLVLSISLAGSRILTQRGRETLAGDGEAIVASGAEFSTTTTLPSRFVTFSVPFRAIAALVPDFESRLARTIPRDTEALGLLAGYARGLQDTDSLATPDARRLAVTHMYDLVALALGATGDGAAAAGLRGARAARLSAIKEYITENIGADLSIAAIAARHRIPVRYLQRLFEAAGIAFSDFVLGERLARAHRMLSDPRLAARPIGTIAFAVGFSNFSHFSRVFRGRFGMSPSDVRAAALHDANRFLQ